MSNVGHGISAKPTLTVAAQHDQHASTKKTMAHTTPTPLASPRRKDKLVLSCGLNQPQGNLDN
jgi:hypothetical protein